MNNMSNNKEDYKANIQQNIVRLTDQTNISYRELSAIIDASSSYIQKVVAGEFEPSLSSLASIAEYFDIPISSLLNDSSTASPKAVISEITDYLVKLDDKNLDFILTMTKELYNKQS